MSTAQALDTRASFFTRFKPTGASTTAADLKELAEKTLVELNKSFFWNWAGDVIATLDETYAECSDENWDGYGAHPMQAAAYLEARTLLRSMPKNIPLPEVLPMPDGGVGLEWENGPNKIFTVSLSGKGLLTYAGLFGKGRKSHGTEIVSDDIPQNILGLIKRIFA